MLHHTGVPNDLDTLSRCHWLTTEGAIVDTAGLMEGLFSTPGSTHRKYRKLPSKALAPQSPVARVATPPGSMLSAARQAAEARTQRSTSFRATASIPNSSSSPYCKASRKESKGTP